MNNIKNVYLFFILVSRHLRTLKCTIKIKTNYKENCKIENTSIIKYNLLTL